VGSHARKSEVSRPDTITKTFFGVLLSVANSFQDNPARLKPKYSATGKKFGPFVKITFYLSFLS
jgi:hypothetical protein